MDSKIDCFSFKESITTAFELTVILKNLIPDIKFSFFSVCLIIFYHVWALSESIQQAWIVS